MEYYTLQSDESMIYRNDVQIFYDGKKQACTLLLTDKFFVCIIKQKKFLRKDEITVESYAVNTLKTYKDSPNIIRKNDIVELYFIGGERSVIFPDKGEAKKFVAKTMELVTQKSKLIRGIEKTKKVVSEVGDSLGIDKEMAAGVAQNVAQGVAQAGIKALFKKKSNDKNQVETTETLKLPTGIFRRKETKQLPPLSPEEQVAAIEKFKQLLDNGVITQEEFDAKKKEFLGL